METSSLASVSWPTIAVYGALLGLSFVAVTVSIFKIIQFARLGVGRHKRADDIIRIFLSGRPEEALTQASKRETVATRVLQATFTGMKNRPNDKGHAEELARQSALLELATISERMRILDSVVQMAPIVGLLGTVIGMIQAFETLAQTQGAVDPTLLADGIRFALTTTAIGLSIALFAFVFSNVLQSRIDREKKAIQAVVSIALNGRVASPETEGRRRRSSRR